MKAMMRCLVVVIFVGTISTHVMAQWVQVNKDSKGIGALAVSGNNLFAGSSDSGVFLSTNNGTSWTQTCLDSVSISTFAFSGTNLFAGTVHDGIFLSSDNGISWKLVRSDLPIGGGEGWGELNSWVTALAFKPNGTGSNDIFAAIIYAGEAGPKGIFSLEGQRIYRSTDNGTNWILADSGFTNNIQSFLVDGSNLVVGTGDNCSDSQPHSGDGVLLSTNNGSSWTAVNKGLPKKYSSQDTTHYYNINALIKNNSRLFAGTDYGIYLSTNSGINWTKSFDTVVTTSFAASGNNLFAGTNNGVILSTNSGASWTSVNTGLSNLIVRSLILTGSYLFAGTDKGVYRRPLSEMVTSVKQSSTQMPERYSLSQNYPNPFNPSTTLRFSIPEQSTVRFSIFNTLGQTISEMVNEVKDAGSYEQSFNASQLSSGIYFYRIEATSVNNSKTFVETKKMMLMR